MAGRAELCGPRGAVFGGLLPVTPQDQEKVDRSQPIAAVTLDGKQITTETYVQNLKTIEVEETTGLAMNMARVVFVNPEGALTDDSSFQEQVEMTIELGFAGVGLEKLGGKFLVQMPRYRFTGMPEVDILAFGEEIKLGRTERRRAFKRVRDSDIARQIAEQNGLEADVEDTDQRHDQVLQANESDYKLLHRLALLHGYMIFVENSVLHFHPPRYRDNGVKLIYRGEEEGTLLRSVSIETRPPLLRAATYKATQIDPMELDVFEVTSSEEPDDVTRESLSSVKTPKKWNKIAAIDGEQAERFMVGEGFEQRKTHLQEQVDAFSQSTRWMIKASGAVPGILGLHSNDVVELLGIGRHSGKYYVTRVKHVFRDGYSMSFELMRTFTGDTVGSKNTPSVVEPRSAGFVDLG